MASEYDHEQETEHCEGNKLTQESRDPTGSE